MTENWSIWSPALTLVGVISGFLAFLLYSEDDGKYNVLHIPRDLWELFKNLVLGKRYIVKVNGVWSVCRGYKQKYDRLIVRYGPDWHKWILQRNEWHNIEKEWDVDRIDYEVVGRNIHDLEAKHPLKTKKRMVHDYLAAEDGNFNYDTYFAHFVTRQPMIMDPEDE